MDDLTEDFAEFLDDYSTREILEALAQAIKDNSNNEENPDAWRKLAVRVDELAGSQEVEDTIAW